MSKFFKDKEARGLLSSISGVKITVVSNLPLLHALF